MGERAAVMILITKGKDDFEVLLLKRKEDPGDRWSGQICLPGGRAEEGDGDLIETAIREVREETGIKVDRNSIIFALEPVFPLNSPSLKVSPFIAELKEKKEVRPGDEIEDAFWVPLSELKEVDPKAYGLSGEIAYKIKYGIVWGMTARIIKKFLGLFRVPP